MKLVGREAPQAATFRQSRPNQLARPGKELVESYLFVENFVSWYFEISAKDRVAGFRAAHKQQRLWLARNIPTPQDESGSARGTGGACGGYF